MASTDIQIVSITNLEKIQTFLNDSAYKEILENSENYNTRLCIERRLRMPFLDPQTGVAQNHCALFMKQKQRMPGFRDGQIYTYPSSRWRKPKRQYLLQHHNYRAFSFRENQDVPVVSSVEGSSVSGTADNDSKDSHRNDEKDWFYEDLDINHVEDFEEDPESDFDFDESYSSRRRKRKNVGAPRKSTVSSDPTPVKRGRGRGKGRKKADGESRRGGGAAGRSSGPPSLPPNTSASASPLNNAEEPQMPILTPEQKLPGDEADPERRKVAAAAAAAATATAGSATAASSTGSAGGATPTGVTKPRTERGKAPPSPYCDFCLGDARENKKTSLPEELVSCSDCGRSGHPSCLQFTPNMIISVKRYRWQCIECKYCSICGTSDNDDQLLFCDDCDRGYHMYCLSPPLTVPPEGSWSCKLCLEEFHSGKKKD